MAPPVAVAAGVAAAVAGAAWRARALTAGGAVAAWSVGTAILVGAGWAGGAVLAAFFVSSTVVDRVVARMFRVAGIGPAPPRGVGVPLPDQHTVLQGHTDASRQPHPGERRDGRQVYANGGVAALGALFGLRSPTLGMWVVVASLAGAAADTWATGFGAASRRLPRMLGFGRRVAAGTNGGMSVIGTLGGLAGALVVAGTGALVSGLPLLFPIGTLIGFGGMLIDSLLGAVVQGRFACPDCGVASERRIHRCGTRTEWTGGVQWLTNDGVNLLATIAAATMGAIAYAAVYAIAW